MTETNQENEPTFLTSMIKVPIRKRYSISENSARITYQITRETYVTIKGKRIHFQIYKETKPMFHSKLKGKRPTRPIPIGRGSEVHFSQKDFAAFLLSDPAFLNFSLRAKTEYGKELLSIHAEYRNGDKKLPRIVKINFFAKDSLIPRNLVSKDPVANEDGQYELFFHNKPVISSIKNFIFIDPNSGIEFCCIRRVSKTAFEVDTVDMMSPLAILGLVVAVNIIPT